MANDKKNINELVSDDDDPTAELEQLVLPAAGAADDIDDLSEAAASTHGFSNTDRAINRERDAAITELESDLKNRSETINRLQYDIEQLRARWTGLEKEIEAREELTGKLNAQLSAANDKLQSREKLLKKRDKTIKSFKREIRDRNNEFSALQTVVIERDQEIEKLQQDLSADRSDEAEHDRRLLEQQAGQIASAESTIIELREQITRTESYADSLRQKLQDSAADTSEAEDTREFLKLSAAQATENLSAMAAELSAAKSDNATLTRELDGIKEAHEEQIRMIRFELGEAQETVAQHEMVTEQLASDLVDTRSFKDELEKMLSQTEEKNQARIESLDKENRRLKQIAAENKQKLQTKSEAINCLLAELAKKSEQIESIGEIEDVIQDIDNRMSERIDERSSKDKDRVTRVLIGTVDGQELRFPLFKNRLTIGRTEQNDIQLDATYVSRRHAVIVTDHDTTRVIDWGSKNGVMVNSNRITEHFLKNGDTVTIGTADFRYEERPKRDI
jgi:chromosome segregation ATPase